MNIAFLFNSDHKSLGGNYGDVVMDHILGAQVLQRADRHMRVSIGDILTHSIFPAKSSTLTMSFLVKLCRDVYRPKHFDRLINDRLEGTHGTAVVFCWLFQNMTAEIADELHSKLSLDPAYLGAMDVDFSEPHHRKFFHNQLCEVLRLQGKCCSVFYYMGEDETSYIVAQECFERHGFTVNFEDIGLRGTIFDKYNTMEHFKRVEDFKLIFAKFNGIGADQASDLALNIEEIHPKLFDAFAAAARTLERAQTEEDYAQAALSGRRFLENIADYLFPPREDNWNGHKVGRTEYKNRLWAYIEQTITESNVAGSFSLAILGKEADRLFELFNTGLHSNPMREEIEVAFTDLVIWLSKVIALSPSAVRRLYLAYEQELRKFIKGIKRSRPQ